MNSNRHPAQLRRESDPFRFGAAVQRDIIPGAGSQDHAGGRTSFRDHSVPADITAQFLLIPRSLEYLTRMVPAAALSIFPHSPAGHRIYRAGLKFYPRTATGFAPFHQTIVRMS